MAKANDNGSAFVTSTRLPEQVATYVRDLITSGQARPGEFLRIERIAEAVGVSQTPVREGLLQLANEGLINLLPRRGFMVAPITREDVLDLYWAHATLSGELAARATTTITGEQLEVLAANCGAYSDAVVGGDWERIPDIGLEFHRELNRAAHAHRLVLILESVMASLPNRSYAAGNPKHTNAEHPQLLKAIKKGDPEVVRKLMVKHIADQGERLIEILAERGLWSD